MCVSAYTCVCVWVCARACKCVYLCLCVGVRVRVSCPTATSLKSSQLSSVTLVSDSTEEFICGLCMRPVISHCGWNLLKLVSCSLLTHICHVYPKAIISQGNTVQSSESSESQSLSDDVSISSTPIHWRQVWAQAQASLSTQAYSLRPCFYNDNVIIMYIVIPLI